MFCYDINFAAEMTQFSLNCGFTRELLYLAAWHPPTSLVLANCSGKINTGNKLDTEGTCVPEGVAKEMW